MKSLLELEEAGFTSSIGKDLSKWEIQNHSYQNSIDETNYQF